jgi:hypothetical protein
MILAAATAHKPTGFAVSLHQGFFTVVVVYAIIVTLWGALLFLRGSGPTGSYRGALFIMQGVAMFQSLAGLIVLATGYRPHDALHYLYGVAVVLTLPVAYSFSLQGDERRASGIYARAGLALVGLAVRASTTGGS